MEKYEQMVLSKIGSGMLACARMLALALGVMGMVMVFSGKMKYSSLSPDDQVI